MSVDGYIDYGIFAPLFGNTIPDVTSPGIEAICKELSLAIRMNEEIFVYGDYDMDGFCAAMVWENVLSSLYKVPVRHFQYIQRMHTLDYDVIRQVRKSNARCVIICDTGSSVSDRAVMSVLRANGNIPIVIDHHNWDGQYHQDQASWLIFNSHEERNLFNQAEISGAYASLVVAARLCRKYFSHSVSYDAMVYALASMYSDVVDLSTEIGRALYNAVSLCKMPGPTLLNALNTKDYKYTRRMFSFFVSPKVNACFRLEQFGVLNRAFEVRDKHTAQSLALEFGNVHSESIQRVNTLVPLFAREQYGSILLCIHEPTMGTEVLQVRNFSGLIANRIAREEMCAVVTLIKTGNTYEGSFRDYYNRKMLDVFKLFCTADGHDVAFGISTSDLNDFRRHLAGLTGTMKSGARSDYFTISSQLIEDSSEIDALALYNEYMNVQPKVMLNHRTSYCRVLRANKWGRKYEMGLPLPVRTKAPVLEGHYVLIEPTVTRDVELIVYE